MVSLHSNRPRSNVFDRIRPSLLPDISSNLHLTACSLFTKSKSSSWQAADVSLMFILAIYAWVWDSPLVNLPEAFSSPASSFFLVFQNRVSLYSFGYPGIHSVDQAGPKLRDPPVSASQVLGLKTCAITTWFRGYFLRKTDSPSHGSH